MNFIVPLVIYPYDIMFSVGQSDRRFLFDCKERMQDEYYNDLASDDISISTTMRQGRTFHHLIGGQTIIRLPHKPKTASDRGTVSHEIFHAVDFIFRRINLPLTFESHEAYAYAIGYITEQFYSNCNK